MDPITATMIFLFGLVFGSFLNVCIYRIPLALPDEPPDEPMLRSMLASIAAWNSVCSPSRSFCPHCQHRIRSYDNIPVISWLWLRGHCRDCGAPIRFRYAAVELATGLLFVACYVRFGLTLEALKFCVFAFLLIALIFTDAEHKLLPDAFTVPGILLGLIFSTVCPLNEVASQFAPQMINSHPREPVLSLLDALIGAAVGAGFIWGAGMLYELARGRQGMGLGDVKLMGMVGAFLGLKLTVVTIIGASLLGSLFGALIFPFVWWKRLRRRIRQHGEPFAVARRRAWRSAKLVRYYAMPFGVFLGTVALLAVFFGDDLVRWYWGFFRRT